MSSDHEAEIRASVAAHEDLGPGYDDAVAEGLVERIGAEIDKRIEARLAGVRPVPAGSPGPAQAPGYAPAAPVPQGPAGPLGSAAAPGPGVPGPGVPGSGGPGYPGCPSTSCWGSLRSSARTSVVPVRFAECSGEYRSTFSCILCLQEDGCDHRVPGFLDRA